MSTTVRLWHGGVSGLKRGDLLSPGHARPEFEGCSWCFDRALERSAGRVYVTSSREYARHFASLWGRGDLYRVDPVGEIVPSARESIPTWTAPAARVLAVRSRAVQLTWRQRRALTRQRYPGDLLADDELEELFHAKLTQAVGDLLP